ncbi:FadR/GntR family transcriptional regulator [Metabacillus litoralis]|jgi:GntR family transcriptional regulator, transcriptional repressor for pyruvate dehydrogenase complex|uniref:FadR/GntR family transcriptional regulator n=1 Tax=Metabacillus litoralis TaxID=152268 RepID=UPI002041131A|nr:FadR/GntR family transcriptional regulator [Metabacillus litoralis]MCM3655447.1 FadR family transcriptional regulator [Metabacillus litoralis]
MSDQMFLGVRNERLYEKIVVQIRQLIEDGKLQPGDRLPGERTLAQTLGCSRTSLREACRVLESEGLIVSKPGGGRFIQQVDQNMKLEYRFNTVDMIEKTAVIYFLEARETLEPKIAELAAQRATAENIEKMEQVLLKMEEKLKHPEEMVEADSSFHLALAEATQNFVFVSMMEANLNMNRQVRKQTLNSKERYSQSLAEHRAILDAVKERDVKKAIETTHIHLLHLRKSVLGIN